MSTESNIVEYSENGEIDINPEAVEEQYDNIRIRPTKRNGHVVEHKELPLNLSVYGASGYSIGIDVREEGLEDEALEELEEYLIDEEDGIGASKNWSELYVFNTDLGSPEEVETVLDEINGLGQELENFSQEKETDRYKNAG